MAATLSMREIRSRAAVFAARWADETYERGESQTFWNEFLGIFGIDRRRVASFEKRADRFSTGNKGFIDMFWPGTLLVEQKSAGKDLNAADGQAFDYLDGLDAKDFPSAVVVSDFARIRLTRFDEGKPKSITLDTRSLGTEIDRFAFLAGYVKRDYSAEREQTANAEAVKRMGELYSQIKGDHFTDHQTSVFMTRILFLLFGDDTGLWGRDLFKELIEDTHEDGENVAGVLDQLFGALDKPSERRSSRLPESISDFPYVNGGLFSERVEVPPFDSAMRKSLLACAFFDWGSISPAIFGSMFQVVKSKVDRRSLGEHYTTEANILRTINPLFMDDLRVRLSRAGNDEKRLNELRRLMGKMTFLDPACGCGNFLVIAYREMRELELEIFKRIRAATGAQILSEFEVADTLAVHPSQFFGIEIEEWPAKIAQTALFLIDHQANMRLSQEFGRAPDRLPITEAATIEVGNAVQTDWTALAPATDYTVVLSNPPFVGMDKMNDAQQVDNRIAFGALPEAKGQRTGRLDYVAAWYAKAIDYTRGTRARVGLVSTNSVTQGDQARALDPIVRAAGLELFFAHRTFRWTSQDPNAASVHCAIVGFARVGVVSSKRIFDYPDILGEPVETAAKTINFYLIDSELTPPAKRRKPFVASLPPMLKGSQPTDDGGLIVKLEDYPSVASDPVCAKYLKPFPSAHNMLHSEARWCLWLEESSPTERLSSRELKARLERVKAARLKSKTESVRAQADTAYLFTQRRQPSKKWLAVPRHSSQSRNWIPMKYLGPDVIASDALSYVEDAPLWLFGVLQSKAYTAWVRTFSGTLKSDFRISPDLAYNVFPFIEPDEKLRGRLESAASAVVAARAAYPNESLATLYAPNAMPEELAAAHAGLDRIVDRMYGLRNPTESRRAEALLSYYHKLSKGQGIALTLPEGETDDQAAVVEVPKPVAMEVARLDGLESSSTMNG